MPTFTALTTLSGKRPAEQLGEALEDLDPTPYGVGVFELEDGSGLWEVGAYFHENPDEIALDLLAAVHGAKPFVVSELPEADWVAHVRRQLAPVEAGRFYLYGSHDADTVPDGVDPLLIEASMAFGTGHHGTTLGCLRAFDRLLTEGLNPCPVADIGCGTAVLAMAAARIWHDADTPILASDIDPVAIEVADVNLAANDLNDRVETFAATGLDHPRLQTQAPFGLIFANILKGPLIELAPAIGQACMAEGFAILSGLLARQADAVYHAYAAEGFTVHASEEIGEWTTFCLRKTVG